MIIRESTAYQPGFRRLKPNEKIATIATIELFIENPHHTSLRNHPLKKPMQHLRSISVTDDLRIIFREKGGYSEVLFVSIGDHPSVYGSY